MSSILAIIGAGSPADDAVVHGMVRRMARRGAERVGTARVAGATLAVARNEWETASHLAGPAAVSTHGPYAVVSDAAIHYRDDLRRRLDERGVRAETDSPSALIAAAYAAFGARCVDVLEGNFAFVVWDSQRRELFAARDYGGTRPLHYAQVGDAFVVASTMGGVLAFPGCSPDLDSHPACKT